MTLDDFDPNFLIEITMEYAVAIATALLIFIVGKWVARRLTNMLKAMLERSKVDATLVGFFGNIVYALALTFVIIAALAQLGVETTSLAAVLAAAGLAIGLALQGSLSNFAAGVLIILFRPFAKGHYIEAAGTAGTVEDINIFTTMLITPDNCNVVVPNSAVTGGPIKNYSARPTRRIDLVIGVGYDDDLAKVRDILNEIIANETRVLKDPAPTVAVAELADSSVNFVVRPWVKTDDYWNVRFDLTMAIKQHFDKEGISIPYPQRDVRVIESKAA